MDKIMVPLHDGSGFAEIGSLVKWALTPGLPDQQKRIQKHGAGPFTVLGGGSLLLYFIDQNGIYVKAKPEWLVPAKSLLEAVLDEIAGLAFRAAKSPDFIRIPDWGRVLLLADQTATEKNQALARLKEMIAAISSIVEKNPVTSIEVIVRGHLKEIATALQKK